MGIVAYCPGGHRVKVKDQLAGRMGICPTCGGRFRIPLATGTEHQAGGSQAPAGMPLASVVSLDHELAATLPRAIAQNSAASQDVVPAVIAEATTASWCTAVPGGAASLPMPAGAFLDWLTSDRVTGRELVWRSDWSEWRPVGQVFPDHVPTPPPTFPPAT